MFRSFIPFNSQELVSKVCFSGASVNVNPEVDCLMNSLSIPSLMRGRTRIKLQAPLTFTAFVFLFCLVSSGNLSEKCLPGAQCGRPHAGLCFTWGLQAKGTGKYTAKESLRVFAVLVPCQPHTTVQQARYSVVVFR